MLDLEARTDGALTKAWVSVVDLMVSLPFPSDFSSDRSR